MNKTPFGLCPICSTELRLDDELLVCPSGDYQAGAGGFEGRWQDYFADIKNGANGLAAAEELLKDLQGMNLLKDSNENNP